MYFGGATYVSLNKADGTLVFCVDTRIQPEFFTPTGYNVWVISYSFDLADMTADELRDYNGMVYYGWIEEPHGPTDAKQAYECAVAATEELVYGRMSGAGDEFIVYYSEKADAWIVEATTFIYLISRETGERLYLNDNDKPEDLK